MVVDKVGREVFEIVLGEIGKILESWRGEKVDRDVEFLNCITNHSKEETLENSAEALVKPGRSTFWALSS